MLLTLQDVKAATIQATDQSIEAADMPRDQENTGYQHHILNTCGEFKHLSVTNMRIKGL